MTTALTLISGGKPDSEVCAGLWSGTTLVIPSAGFPPCLYVCDLLKSQEVFCQSE